MLLLQMTGNASMRKLICDETSTLYAQNPGHELLKYVLSPLNDVLWHEFVNRFGEKASGERKDVIAKAYNAYYVALHKAVEENDTSIKVPVCDDLDSY